MNEEYPARYSDPNGAEETILRNDGKTLRIRLRGVEFSGSMFDDFEPDAETESSKLLSFPYRPVQPIRRLRYRMGDAAARRSKWRRGTRRSSRGKIVLGVPDERGRLDKVELRLTLDVNGKEYSGSRRNGYFECALLEIQDALPGKHGHKSLHHLRLLRLLSPVGSGTIWLYGLLSR